MGDAQLTKADFETFVEIGERIEKVWQHVALQTQQASEKAARDGDQQLASHEADRAEQTNDRADDIGRAVRLAERWAAGLPDDA